MRECSRVLLVCAMLAALPRGGRAQQGDEKARARELFQRAEEKYRAKQYGAALELYQEAYRLTPLPGFHFNIGQCYRNLDQYDEAVIHFRAYLEKSQNPRNRKRAEELIARCETLKRHQQRDAEQVESAGASSQPMAATQSTAPAAPRADRRPFRPYHFWGAVGISAALLLAGTVSGAMAMDKSVEFNDPDTPYNKLRSLKNTGEALRTTSAVTFVLGGLAAIGTTVLYYYTDFGPVETAVTAAPAAGGATLLATGRF